MSTSKKKVNQISSAVIQAALTVIFYTIVVMLIYAGVKKAYSFGYEVFNQQPVAEAPGTDKVFVVEEGMSASDCLDALEKSGLIRDHNVALIQKFFYEYEFYPGTYTLNTSMTTREIMAELNEKPAEETTAATAAATQEDTSEAETKEIIEGDD